MRVLPGEGDRPVAGRRAGAVGDSADGDGAGPGAAATATAVTPVAPAGTVTATGAPV